MRETDRHNFSFRLLRWFCPRHLQEEIEGDLIQRFHRDVSSVGEQRARRKLFWNTLRFFRTGIVLRSKFSWGLNSLDIVMNYFKIASRGMARNKMFSVINVLGLSVSMTVCLMILLYVKFELSYDNFHHESQKIYRVATKVTLQNEVVNHETNTYEGISYALKRDFPDVQHATTIHGFDSDNNFIHYEDEQKKLTPLPMFKAFEVDSNFFQVFSFPIKQGDPSTAFQEHFSVLISETFADQYFAGDAIGKFVEVNNGTERNRYRISAVLKDVPSNSHFKFDLLTYGRFVDKSFWNGDVSFWDWTGQTYVKLQHAAEPLSVESKLALLAVEKNGLKSNKSDYGQVSTFELQPLRDIHLFSHLDEELENNGNGAMVYALAIIGCIVILMAWVNYINLSTAILEEKRKSIGVRKIVGASRRGLIVQIITESALYNLLSLGLAIFSACLLLPYFSNFAGVPKDYSLLYDKGVVLVVAAFATGNTLLSGLYPASVVSSIQPIRALTGRGRSGRNFVLRKALVVFQFTAAPALLIIAIVAYQQVSFMRTKKIGITVDNVVVIKALNFDKESWSTEYGGFVVDSTYQNKVSLFKEDIRSKAMFANLTSLSHLPGSLPNWGSEFKASSNDPAKAYRLQAIGIDYDFISTLQATLIAGRNFSPDFSTDRGNEGRRAVLVNESAASLLGFESPANAVHSHISTYWGADYEIIGVVNSFHQLSFKENLQPLYFILEPRALEYFAVRCNGEDAGLAIDELHKSWSQYFPDYPFQYFFLDQYYDRQYQYDQKFSDLMTLFSAFTIFVACLGLFGLTSYAVIQRTKEVGIRKVLGATISDVIKLFTRDFAKLILAGSCISVPLVYFGVARWLENYAYRIELGWWIFAIPVIAILSAALITVSLQTMQVALRNPVDSLKHD